VRCERVVASRLPERGSVSSAPISLAMIALGALPAAVVLRCGAVALIAFLLGIALWRTSKLVEAEKRVCTPS
jgi:hypothetical protein